GGGTSGALVSVASMPEPADAAGAAAAFPGDRACEAASCVDASSRPTTNVSTARRPATFDIDLITLALRTLASKSAPRLRSRAPAIHVNQDSRPRTSSVTGARRGPV